MALKKEIEEDNTIGKDILCAWIQRINIVKITTIHQSLPTESIIPIKIPTLFFTSKKKKSKILYGGTGDQEQQSNLE